MQFEETKEDFMPSPELLKTAPDITEEPTKASQDFTPAIIDAQEEPEPFSTIEEAKEN
jgi:hypothetical protein